MKRAIIILLVVSSLAFAGCGSRWGSAGLGAAGGAAAGVGGYEWQLNKELERIQEARQEGKMSEEEYQIRKDQIQRLSILK
jgi:hypothetical protein